jgi:hypothetical protein
MIPHNLRRGEKRMRDKVEVTVSRVFPLALLVIFLASVVAATVASA